MICGFGPETESRGGENRQLQTSECMAREGERKRKAGIELDFDKLLPRDDEPPPELLIQEKSMPLAEAEPRSDNYIRNLPDKELKERITRNTNFANANATILSDGGAKLRAIVNRMEAELARRSLDKVGFLSSSLFVITQTIGYELSLVIPHYWTVLD